MIRLVLHCSVLLLVNQAIAKDPQAYKDYIDSEVREVEISETLALTVCVSNTAVSTAFDDSYNKCFGSGYDWEALAKESEESGEYGLSKDFEEKEVCFYKSIGWTDGKTLNVDTIKANAVGMDPNIKKAFEDKIDECNTWTPSGSNSRMRRDVEARESNLIQTISRERRGIRNGNNGGNNGNKNGNNGGNNGNKNGNNKGNNNEKPKRRNKNGNNNGGKRRGNNPNRPNRPNLPNRPNRPKQPNAGKGKARKKNGRQPGRRGGNGNGNGGGNNGGSNNGKRNNKGNSKGKGAGSKPPGGPKSMKNQSGGIDSNLYAQLWCSDLALEQALEQCVEQKISP